MRINRRKYSALVLIGGVFAGLIFFAQNCARFEASPPSETQSLSSDYPAQMRATPLKCDHSQEYTSSGTPLSDDERIQAHDRLQIDALALAYLSEEGKLFIHKFSSEAEPVWVDQDYRYKSISKASGNICGVTLENEVRCATSTAFENHAELNGSIQVRLVRQLPCGLFENGSIVCLTDAGTYTQVVADEPIVLSNQSYVIGESSKKYLIKVEVDRYSLIEDPYPGNRQLFYLMNDEAVISYGSNIVSFCNEPIYVKSFPENLNYNSDFGCALSSSGKLFCLFTDKTNPDFPRLQSVRLDGTVSDQLVEFAPGSYFSSVRISGYGTGCAIERGTLKPMCFSIADSGEVTDDMPLTF